MHLPMRLLLSACAILAIGGCVDTPTESVTGVPKPTASVASNSGYSSVTAGENFSCGLRTDQTVFCWGSNQKGQLLAPSGTFTKIDAAVFAENVCGIRSTGEIACWGDSSNGIINPPTGHSRSSALAWFTPVPSAPTVPLPAGEIIRGVRRRGSPDRSRRSRPGSNTRACWTQRARSGAGAGTAPASWVFRLGSGRSRTCRPATPRAVAFVPPAHSSAGGAGSAAQGVRRVRQPLGRGHSSPADPSADARWM